jgi:hypothetical protein
MPPASSASVPRARRVDTSTFTSVGKLAARDEEAAVGAEVHVIDAAAWHRHRLDQLHVRRIQEIQLRFPFRHDYRKPPVRGGNYMLYGSLTQMVFPSWQLPGRFR